MSCVDELLSRYKDQLPEDRLQKIIDSVKQYKDDGGNLGSGSAKLRNRLVYEFQKEVHYKVRQDIDTRKLKAFANQETFKKNMEEFKTQVMPDLDSPDPKVRAAAEKKMMKMNLYAPIEAKASGLETFAEGGNRHYRLVQQQKESELLNSLENTIGKDNLKVLLKGDFDIELAKAIQDIGNNKPVTNLPAEIQQAAMAIHKANKAMVDDLSEVGVWIPERKNYITRQTHDSGKMMDAGKEAWSDFVAQEGMLDEDLVFQGVNSLEERLQILDDIYEKVIDGSYGSTSPGSFTGARELHFSSPEKFVEYNRKFGKGSLLNTVVSSVRSASKAYAKTDLFGVNPRKGVEILEEEITKGFSPRAKALFKDSPLFSKRRNVQNQLNEVMGDLEYPVSRNKIINTLRTGRTLFSASMLKFSVFSTFTDLSFGRLIESSGVHIDRLKSIGEFAKKFSNSKDRKYWETRLDMNFGDMATQSDKYGSFGGGSGGAVDQFYRRYVMPMNLMNVQNASAKLTWGQQIAVGLGTKDSSKSFGELNERLQSTLKRYEISEKEWDKIRESKFEVDEGVYSIDPQSVRDATGDKKLASKVSLMLNDLARGIGSPEAGIKEISMITQGGKQGSLEREFMLSLGQFKSFAFTIPKIIKRTVNNNPDVTANELKDILSNTGELKMLGMFMAEMTMVSAAALTARSAITQGEVNDFSNPEATASFFVEAAQRGAMPMFSSMLIDVAKGEYAQFGRSMFKDLAGPTVSEVDKMVKVLSGVLDRESPTFLQGTELVLKYLPGTQLTYLAPLGLKSFAQELKEMQRPGYMERLERRKKQEGTIKPDIINPFR